MEISPLTPSRIQPMELSILSNSPALHSLKRQQLIQLCKQYSLKANGKNVDLIERLKQFGKQVVQSTEGDCLNASTASWDLVNDTSLSDQYHLIEFGVNQQSGNGNGLLVNSGSNSSLASTIKSAGTRVFHKFSSTNSTSTVIGTSTCTPSIYPSLKDAFERYPASPPKKKEEAKSEEDEKENFDQTLEEFDHSIEGCIRRVTTHTTVDTSTSRDRVNEVEEEEISPVSFTAPSAFVFGSPTTTNSFNFSMTMPGSLLSLSTSSSTRDDASTPNEGGGRGAQVSILEEMNRRALESRLEAEKLGIKISRDMGVGATGVPKSPEKGSKLVEFDGKHKRVFEKMDSITNHYAAKRPHASSSNLAALATSSSSKTLNASTSIERPTKRTKPTASANVVSALRRSGWVSGSASSGKEEEKVSLKNSIRGVASSIAGGSLKGKEKAGSMMLLREDREKEREEKRRRLELAKARRKSGAAVPGRRRRPSTIVGPKHSGSVSSTTSSFLKSTLKRFTPSTFTSTPAPLPAPSTSTSISQTPRFAIPTASSSTRAGLVASSSIRSGLVSSTSSRTLASPTKKEPGWKKFDLQESLKRPMTWKTHLSGSTSISNKPSTLSRSNSLLSPPAPLSRQVSARVANPSLLSATTSKVVSPVSPSLSTSTSTLEERTMSQKLASLPAAPTTPFTNLSNTTSSSIKTKGSIGQNGNGVGKKMVSSSTRKARSGKSTTQTIEGLETKARKIRAVKKQTGKL